MKKIFSIVFATLLCFATMTFAVTGVSAKTKNQTDAPKKGDTIAVLHTNYGDIAMSFFKDEAPKGVENFVTLAKEKKYNNTIFHRVIDNFMIQGGDYTESNGTGGESIWGEAFENECVDNLSNIRGAVAYANSGPDTNGSQFYINSKDNSESLDGSYTVFGQVFEGMDVVDTISKCEKTFSNSGEQSSPVHEVKLESVEVKKYSDKIKDDLKSAVDPYEGMESTDSSENADTDSEQLSNTSTTSEEDEEPFNFVPIIIAVGVIVVIFAAFAIPYAISDKKKKKAKAEAKAKMKANPDYKKKKSTKKKK